MAVVTIMLLSTLSTLWVPEIQYLFHIRDPGLADLKCKGKSKLSNFFCKCWRSPVDTKRPVNTRQLWEDAEHFL
jgi:hypothetical protein